MPIGEVSPQLRSKDAFHHIDMGFLNRRLCLTALPQPIREVYFQQAKSGADHFTQLQNDHLAVTMLLDVCDQAGIPTLLEALEENKPRLMFRSTEKLHACPEIYTAERVEHAVELPFDFGKPVRIAYGTEHIISSTGKLTLAQGYKESHVESIVGVLHNESERFRIEPIVIGAPWFDHPRNGTEEERSTLMWLGGEFGEILPEDIDQFSRMKDIQEKDTAEWQDVIAGFRVKGPT